MLQILWCYWSINAKLWRTLPELSAWQNSAVACSLYLLGVLEALDQAAEKPTPRALTFNLGRMCLVSSTGCFLQLEDHSNGMAGRAICSPTMAGTDSTAAMLGADDHLSPYPNKAPLAKRASLNLLSQLISLPKNAKQLQ